MQKTHTMPKTDKWGIPYFVQKPYPIPEGLKPNRRDAEILTVSYCGQVSELSAIHQYIYHHVEMPDRYERIASGIKNIGIVEMRHLEMLGDCIKGLGLRPEYRYYRHGHSRYWNAGFVTYGEMPREMLEADLKGEYDAIRLYKETVQELQDPQVKKLISRIIEDEEMHIRILKEMIRSLR